MLEHKVDWLAKAWSVLWPTILSYGAKLVFDLTIAAMMAPAAVGEQLPRVVMVWRRG